jgi:hypothetical protein
LDDYNAHFTSRYRETEEFKIAEQRHIITRQPTGKRDNTD